MGVWVFFEYKQCRDKNLSNESSLHGQSASKLPLLEAAKPSEVWAAFGWQTLGYFLWLILHSYVFQSCMFHRHWLKWGFSICRNRSGSVGSPAGVEGPGLATNRESRARGQWDLLPALHRGWVWEVWQNDNTWDTEVRKEPWYHHTSSHTSFVCCYRWSCVRNWTAKLDLGSDRLTFKKNELWVFKHAWAIVLLDSLQILDSLPALCGLGSKASPASTGLVSPVAAHIWVLHLHL